MIRSIRIFILITILIFSSNSVVASTHDCAFKNLDPANRAVKKSLQADLVFIGTVVKAHFPSRLIVEPKSLEEQLRQTVIFDVLSSWKGVNLKTIEARVSPSCIYGLNCELTNGKTYLAYGYVSESGQVSVSALCSDTIPLEEAADQTKALDEAYSK